MGHLLVPYTQLLLVKRRTIPLSSHYCMISFEYSGRRPLERSGRAFYPRRFEVRFSVRKMELFRRLCLSVAVAVHLQMYVMVAVEQGAVSRSEPSTSVHSGKADCCHIVDPVRTLAEHLEEQFSAVWTAHEANSSTMSIRSCDLLLEARSFFRREPRSVR